MWSWKWWKDVGERAIRTFATSLGAWILVAGQVAGFEDLNWLRGLSIAGLSALLSVLAALGTHSVTGNGPSFTSVYKPDEPQNKHVRGNDDNSRD